MNSSPMPMNSASGTSLAMVNAFTTHALCRMPRTLIDAKTLVSPASNAMRGQPVVISGQ